MADNTELNAGSGGDTIASDDIAGVKYQRVKVVLGADNTNDGDVASGNPMPVTGTVTANLGATDNAVLDAIQAAVEVIDNAISGSEMQVDVVSSALPTGAATAAKQPALGTAGTASSDVITVQGIASMTALAVDGSAVTQPVSGTVTANLGATDNAVLDAIQAAVEIIDNAISGSEMQVDVVASLPAGTNNIGDVDIASALPSGTNNIGDVDVLTVPTVLAEAASTDNATSSDGATALTNTAQAIKASAGSLKGYYIYNPNSGAAFVQFYNTASGSVTVGTTNPLFMLTIPATSAANLWMQPGGVAFSTAMSWAATSTAGGNGALSTALDAVAWYT